MLELRPSCEHCNRPLPPESTEARICSFECTFCADCVDARPARHLPELRRRLRAATDPACARPQGRQLPRQVPGEHCRDASAGRSRGACRLRRRAARRRQRASRRAPRWTLVDTRCCIVGGGPAGMMLGFLLARAGVGPWCSRSMPTSCATSAATRCIRRRCASWTSSACSTPSCERPHQRLSGRGRLRRRARPARRLQRPARALRLHRHDAAVGLPRLPRRRGATLPAFTLRMQAEVTGLIEDGGRVAGVRGRAPEGRVRGPRRLHGRLRRPPFDGARRRRPGGRGRRRADRRALVPRRPRPRPRRREPLPASARGHFVVTLDRGDYWQCAFVIPKGGAEALQRQPIDVFRAQVVRDRAAARVAHRRRALAGTTSSC